MGFVKETFYKMVLKYVCGDPAKKKEIETFEKLTLAEINLEIAKSILIVLNHYSKSKAVLAEDKKNEMMKSCFYWFLLKTNLHKFEKFPKTDDWIDFCQEIEEKSSEQIEKLLKIK